MSWILGVAGKRINQKILDNIKTLSKESDSMFESRQLIFYSGGIKETNHIQVTSKSPSRGWFVSGVGIEYAEQEFKLMSKNDWSSFFSNTIEANFNHLNGHFITIQWNSEEVTFNTDQLGLRHLYFTESRPGQFVFSTRLDWISKLNKKSVIDFHEFGSQWLLQNKVSLNSTVTETSLISQGGKATYFKGSLSTSNSPWSPLDEQIIPEENHISVLEKLTILAMNDGKSLSLALSGGFDSRVLLSILLSSKSKNWSLHSLHNPENPDNKIPIQISTQLGIEHQFFTDDIPDISKSLSLLENYIGYTQAVSPASNIIGFQFYNKLYKQNKLVIDGGLGEIARRRYLNRLLISGKKALLSGNIQGIRPYLKMFRASIFNEDVTLKMEEGVDSQLSSFIDSMPAIEETGIENWLDLMAIRTRFPNLVAFEQSRADSEVLTYMPFAQPLFLHKMLSAPVSERRNSKFLKQIIRNNNYLSSVPLVKHGLVYPYFLSTIATSVYLKIRGKSKKIFKDNISDLFLESLSDYILDTVNSSSVKNCDYYDYNIIAKAADSYYKGDKSYNSFLNWWLSFEIFRQQVSTKI